MMTNKQKIRLALVMMLGAYPLITALLYVTAPFTSNWALWAKGLIVIPPMVFGMVFFITPYAHKWFGGWIKGE